MLNTLFGPLSGPYLDAMGSGARHKETIALSNFKHYKKSGGDYVSLKELRHIVAEGRVRELSSGRKSKLQEFSLGTL